MSSVVAPLNILAGMERLSKDLDQWTLHRPDPPSEREYLARIDFSVEFSGPPVVHIGVAGFDIENGDFARLKVRAQYIDRAGFTLIVGTCFGTVVHGVDVSWLALGT